MYMIKNATKLFDYSVSLSLVFGLSTTCFCFCFLGALSFPLRPPGLFFFGVVCSSRMILTVSVRIDVFPCLVLRFLTSTACGVGSGHISDGGIYSAQVEALDSVDVLGTAAACFPLSPGSGMWGSVVTLGVAGVGASAVRAGALSPALLSSVISRTAAGMKSISVSIT